MSVTVKAHTLFMHVAQFLHYKKTQSGPMPIPRPRGLDFWSEQASESVHHDFEKFWEQGYKRQLSLKQDSVDQGLKCTYLCFKANLEYSNA